MKKGIMSIYYLAKKAQKKDKSQTISDFYIWKELEREIANNHCRFFELRSICNDLSDKEDISVVISIYGVLYGYVILSEDKVAILIIIFILAFIEIFLPISFKKCKFVLDNMENSEYIKMMKEIDEKNKLT